MLSKLFRPNLIIGTLPVTLANGTTADATQVMSDLNYVVNQVNANAAPLANPTFTGTVTTAAISATNITASGTLAVTGAVSGSLLPPVYDRVVRSAGDITTTSVSLVDVTGATVTFTTKARPVLVGAAIACSNSSGGAIDKWNIAVDGALELGTSGILVSQESAGRFYPYSFSIQTAALTAAAHTIKMQWAVDSGTGTINANTGNSLHYWAHEL